jgi:hypothetical protein
MIYIGFSPTVLVEEFALVQVLSFGLALEIIIVITFNQICVYLIGVSAVVQDFF